MSRVLVDTNIVSYYVRRDTRINTYKKHLVGREWFVSFMTLAEIHAGIFLRGWSYEAVDKLNQELSDCRLVFPDENLCWEWGRIRALRRRRRFQLTTAGSRQRPYP
jgi:predicted nucleic acid-binding protein